MHTPNATCDHIFHSVNDARDLDFTWHAESLVDDGIDLMVDHGHLQAWFTAGSGHTYHVTFYDNGTWSSERPEALNARQRRVLDRLAPALGPARAWIGKTPHHLIIDFNQVIDRTTRRMIRDRLALDAVNLDVDPYMLDGVSTPHKVRISYTCSSNWRHGA